MQQLREQVDDLPDRLAEDLDAHFEHLVLVHQDRLYRFALRLAGNPQDAEEIAQDAFVRAYQALSGYPRERRRALALRPWLYQITLNIFRNRGRRRKLQLVPLADDLTGDREQERPENVAEAEEQRRELATLVATLPERYRVAVALRHIEDLGIAEIAEVVGQPEGTVKSNIHRGIAMLRQAMDKERSEAVR